MKSIWMMVLVASLVGAGIGEVQAKRMGSGGSVGKQSPTISRQAAPAGNAQSAAPAAQPAPAASMGAGAAGAAAKSASPWRGILGGALLGLGLGALLSHLGIGGALASIISTVLMIALLAMAGLLIYRLLRKKSAPQPAYAGAHGGYGGGYGKSSYLERDGMLTPAGSAAPAAGTLFPQADRAAAAPLPAAAAGVPADMDVPAFLRHAKTYFIRLQAAWDRADIEDLREFTTPEMFAELRLQLQERGAAANHTDVVQVEAQLLGVETVGQEYLASVQFSGLIQEEAQAPATAFTEIWNLVKPVTGTTGWTLAGIQQPQ